MRASEKCACRLGGPDDITNKLVFYTFLVHTQRHNAIIVEHHHRADRSKDILTNSIFKLPKHTNRISLVRLICNGSENENRITLAETH